MVAGVEEQRRVVAVHDEAGNRVRGWVVVHVVHAGQAADLAEDRVVRPGHPAEQVGHRDCDSEDHAVEDVQRWGAGHRRQCEDEFGPTESGEAF